MSEEVRIPTIKPIPKHIMVLIRREDIRCYPEQKGNTRFYAYLTQVEGKLAKITVAVKTHKKEWYCKQVAAHIIHDTHCYVGDMVYTCLGGYIVDWHFEIPTAREYYRYSGWGWASAKLYDPWVTVVNMDYMKRLSQYKYSGYDLLHTHHVIQYITQYEKYPVVEFLMKFGYYNFWMSKQICALATKEKAFRKWLIKQRDVKNINYFYVASIINAYKHNRDVTEQEQLERGKKSLMAAEYKELRQAFKGEQEKLLGYIDKQGTSIATYQDYYKACVELGLNMSLDRNRYPHDFKYWHDMRIDQRATKRAEEDAKKRAELYARFAMVIEKYLPLERTKDDVYVVIIAQSPAELIKEGETLHHCVGRMNYDQKVAREQSLIFFVRRADRIAEPFVTMEYSLESNRVLQLYGKNNSTPDEEIRNYIQRKWLPYANRQLKQIAA